MKLIIALGNFSCLVEQVVKGLNLLQEPLRQEEVYSEKCTKMSTCSVMSLYSLQAKFPLDHDLYQWSKDRAKIQFPSTGDVQHDRNLIRADYTLISRNSVFSTQRKHQ